MESKENHQEKLDRKTIEHIGICAFLAVFWVVFLWNFWDKGPFALGINAFVFLAILLSFFIWLLYEKKRYVKKDLLWILPFVLMIMGFLFYDNPFVKMVTILVFLVSFTFFYNYGMCDDKEKRKWDRYFIVNVIIKRVFKIIGNIGKSSTLYLETIIPTNNKHKKVIVKVLLGICLFLIVASTIFIPLLSSADGEFAAITQGFYTWIQNMISVTIMYKIIAAIILAVVLLATVLTWGSIFEYQEKEESSKKVDDVVAGIVLGGILVLYLLFLWVQAKYLWVSALPFDFNETENLVKSGFWQLFVLTLLNILIFFSIYKKTKGIVQLVLKLFTVASLFLLISAAYRMALYVIYYGFSYEKFFASYTVLYCAILLVWLLSRLFINKKADIIKFVAVLFIWMFGVMPVFPVEQFILRSNVALSHRENSRIRLFELTMLSPDVLLLVKNYQRQGVLEEKIGYLEREGVVKSEEEFSWSPWIERQEKIVSEKKWYELNLMNIKYRYFQ